MSYSEDGKETWVGEFLPGDFVGHNAFLDGAPQEFDLTAKTQTAVYSLPVAKVAALMSDSDALAAAIIEDFSRRLSLSDSSLIAAYTLSTKERICAELLRIAAPIGIDPGRHIIRPSPIFVDMARRVNSTRETVSRTVSELQKMGILSREPGAMVVHDTRHLKAAFR